MACLIAALMDCEFDGRNHQRAAARTHELPHLFRHHGGIVVGLIDLVGQAAVFGCQFETAGNALHELPPVVLRKGERLAQTGGPRTVRPIRIERRENHGPRDTRRPFLRHSDREPVALGVATGSVLCTVVRAVRPLK